MFEDIQQTLDDISNRVNTLINIDYNELNQKNVDSALKTVLSEMLVEAGEEAAKQTVEYAYEPLLQRLLENLSNPDHIYVRGGKVLKFFDLDIAGDYDTFLSGVEEAGGHTLTAIAPKIWKYGIYAPVSKSFNLDSLPDYSEVISERLAAWGDKAPFWYFIEFGNMSYDRAFPQIQPTYFLQKFERVVRRIENLAVDIFSSLMQNFLDAEVQQIVVGQIKAGTTVAVSRIEIPSIGLRVTQLRSSRGNTFYNINGVRGFNAATALKELRKYI